MRLMVLMLMEHLSLERRCSALYWFYMQSLSFATKNKTKQQQQQQQYQQLTILAIIRCRCHVHTCSYIYTFVCLYMFAYLLLFLLFLLLRHTLNKQCYCCRAAPAAANIYTIYGHTSIMSRQRLYEYNIWALRRARSRGLLTRFTWLATMVSGLLPPHQYACWGVHNKFLSAIKAHPVDDGVADGGGGVD